MKLLSHSLVITSCLTVHKLQIFCAHGLQHNGGIRLSVDVALCVFNRCFNVNMAAINCCKAARKIVVESELDSPFVFCSATLLSLWCHQLLLNYRSTVYKCNVRILIHRSGHPTVGTFPG